MRAPLVCVHACVRMCTHQTVLVCVRLWFFDCAHACMGVYAAAASPASPAPPKLREGWPLHSSDSSPEELLNRRPSATPDAPHGEWPQPWAPNFARRRTPPSLGSTQWCAPLLPCTRASRDTHDTFIHVSMLTSAGTQLIHDGRAGGATAAIGGAQPHKGTYERICSLDKDVVHRGNELR